MEKVVEYSRPIAEFVGIAAVAVAAALIVNHVVFRVLGQFGRRSPNFPEEALSKHCRKPGAWTLIVIALHFVLPVLAIPERFQGPVTQVVSLAFIGVISWLLIKMTYVLDEYVVGRFDVDKKDNLRARKIQTQLRVLKRIVVVIVGIVALGTMLMTFEKVRQVGTTILASAGIIGVVVGIAAQRTIGTFIAGLQIAFTQPIRVDDVVIVENEWGRIEEITLTYVVVKIWDLRRLVVPITYFIEKPFQNWTRVTADILGTVYLYVDYTVPVEAVREELRRILENSEHWDRKVCVLQVTNTSERAAELRALMSAADASTAWSLRCEVREKLVAFIQRNYPQALPKLRAEFEKAALAEKAD